MKTTNADFLAEQLKRQVADEFRVELFRQFAGAITARDSATQIKVAGDATDLLSNGDTFIIPTDDYDTEHVITSAPSYASGVTTIVCSASSFATTVIGLDVAKKFDVTADVLEHGFSNIRIQTEGESLNSLMADDVEISLNNSAETYFDNDGSSGHFNSTDIFWVKIIFKLETDDTEFLMFGGTVWDFQPLHIDETITIYCVGHFKELERYPGWNATEELGSLPAITGVELVAVINSAVGAHEGRRSLKYFYPDGVDINGLKINSVSDDTPVGFHVVKFQPPDLFQYDYGSWAQQTEGATGQTLTSAEGHTIDVDIPSAFDLIAREDVILVENFISPEVKKTGRPVLQFSNGVKQQLKFDFEQVIRYDDGGSAYTDITNEVATNNIGETLVFEAADDALYIMSPKPFLGINFDLNSDLVADLTFEYSQGFNDWGSLAVTDGTSDFSQSGAVTWDSPADWRQTNMEIGSDDYLEYYFIRIYIDSYTSGDAYVKRATRYFRLSGDDGLKLDVKIKLEKLPEENREDEIVLKNDSSGSLQPCVWRQNMSLQAYLEMILDNAEYTSSYRTVDDLQISAAAAIISLYGRPPKTFYDKKPTALCVDTSTTPETIYLGIKDELWKVTETGGFEFIDRLDMYHKPSGTGSGPEGWHELNIVRLAIDGNGYLQGFAIGRYEEYYANSPEAYRLPAIVFRSTTLTEITEQNQVDDINDLSVVFPGTSVFRMGYFHDSNQNTAGQDSVSGATTGENIAIPFRQNIWYANPYSGASQNSVLYDVNSLTGNSISGNGRKYPTAQELFFVPPGYYYSADHSLGDGDNGNIGLRWSLGQKGFIVWDEVNDVWIVLAWDGSSYYIDSVSYENVRNNLYNTSNYQTQILAGAIDDNYIYFAAMTWDENGGTFPGDLSDCTLERINHSGASHDTLFSFAAHSVQANQSLAAGDEKYCTIIDMVKCSAEASIHGCLLNRNTFEYHYFVYHINSNKLYTTQTGSDFTFNDNRQISEFIYSAEDEKVFAVVVDKRYNDQTAYLISATFASPPGAPDGTEIELTFEANIKENETDIVQLAMGGSGRLYGITGNNDNYLFQYDDNFYPRFFLADTGDDSFRTVVQEIAEAVNMIVTVNADRKIHFAERETNKGSMTIEEDDHYIRDTMQPVTRWQHRYDGVEVGWRNPFTGENGVEKSGDFGWQKRILKIDNYFVQYPQLAKLIADLYNDFFSAYRRYLPGFSTVRLDQLECRDKIVFNHAGNYGFGADVEWIIDSVEFDYWSFETKISGIEKLS